MLNLITDTTRASAASLPVMPAIATTESIAHQLSQPIGISANLLRGLRSRLVRRGAGLEADEAAALDRAIDQMMLAARLVGRMQLLTGSAERPPVQPT